MTHITNLFQSIDEMNTDKFITFLTDDAVFKFGNLPTVEGRGKIKEAVKEFYASINALSHEIINIWEHSDNIICQGLVTYTRKDKKLLC